MDPGYRKNDLNDFVIIFSNPVAYFRPEKMNEILDVERNGMFLTPFHSDVATMPQPLDRIYT